MSYKTSIRPSQLREDLLQCHQRLMLHQVCVLLKSTILGCYEPGCLSMTWFTTAYCDALCKAIIVAVIVIECILSKDTMAKPCSRAYNLLHSIKRSIQEMCLTFVVRRRLWDESVCVCAQVRMSEGDVYSPL